jgi:hypothetical protein
MILLLVLALGGAVAVCFVLGRRNVPVNLADWHAQLSADSLRLQSALDLQVAADSAMTRDALRRAVDARDSMAYVEALRLADIAFRVLEGATTDRLARLRGMTMCVRMASAVFPVKAVSPRPFRLREVRAVLTIGLLMHHLLVSAVERLLLKVLMLRFAFHLTVRAMRGGVQQLRIDPEAEKAWDRCESAVSDWTEGLDPEHVEAFQAMLHSLRAA